jgi:hypothetical protein
MQQEIEANLKNLEAMEQRTSRRMEKLLTVSTGKNVLMLINDAKKLPACEQWIRSHEICINELTVVTPDSTFPGLEIGLQSRETKFYSLEALEMTTGTVALLRNTNVDLLVIVGAHILSKREYEDIGFIPLIEEILLKEAIQPTILFK